MLFFETQQNFGEKNHIKVIILLILGTCRYETEWSGKPVEI